MFFLLFVGEIKCFRSVHSSCECSYRQSTHGKLKAISAIVWLCEATAKTKLTFPHQTVLLALVWTVVGCSYPNLQELGLWLLQISRPEQKHSFFLQQLPLWVLVQDRVSWVVAPICSVADSGGRCLPWSAPECEGVRLCECGAGLKKSTSAQ